MVPTYSGSVPGCLSDLLGLDLIFVTSCKLLSNESSELWPNNLNWMAGLALTY